MKLKKFIQFNENMDVDMDMDMDHDSKPTNYMFFENLQTIKRCIEELLALDETEVDEILSSGHDWASDHIATAKEDIEQVHNFLINNTEHEMEHEYDMSNMYDEPMSADMYLDDEEYDNMSDDTEYEEE